MKHDSKDLSEVWESIYIKKSLIDRLVTEFPEITRTLERYLWLTLEMNITAHDAKDFKKIINESILLILNTEDINAIRITEKNITGLEFMYYALMQSTPNMPELVIPPLPEEIKTPQIVKSMILRYRKYLQEPNLY